MTSFYSKQKLSQLGFKSIGDNVMISKKASIYGISKLSIGNNVRIDDFCVLSAGLGGIQIGNFVHIAIYTSLIGEGKITLEDFSGISSRVSVFSSSDDFSGESLTNPTVPSKYRGVMHGDVFIGRHVIIGTSSVILPGVKLNNGVAIAAFSLIDKDCEEFYIYKGNPAKKIVQRSREFLKLEKEFLKTLE